MRGKSEPDLYIHTAWADQCSIKLTRIVCGDYEYSTLVRSGSIYDVE
jgi:hypothetical protein